MNEYKEMLTFFGAIIIIGLIIASCSVMEKRERTNVMTACFERVESVAECVWFDRAN
jgi:hypothetical protein